VSARLGLALVLALAAAGARAQDLRDFCADRPGKATPACILDAGHLQLETGIADASFQRGGGQRDDVYLIGQTELRLGVSRRTELEAAWTPLSLERTRDAGGAAHRSGVGDLTLGLRTALADPDRASRAAALQAFVTAPTATAGQGAGGWEAGARLPLSLDLAHGFSLGATPEADLRRDGDAHGRHAALSGALSLSHDLAGASVAAELWAERDLDPAGHVTRASLDVSAAWMVGRDLQLDAGANAGLTRATPDLELYLGLARRF
jgi:hypothetical protein